MHPRRHARRGRVRAVDDEVGQPQCAAHHDPGDDERQERLAQGLGQPVPTVRAGRPLWCDPAGPRVCEAPAAAASAVPVTSGSRGRVLGEGHRLVEQGVMPGHDVAPATAGLVDAARRSEAMVSHLV